MNWGNRATVNERIVRLSPYIAAEIKLAKPISSMDMEKLKKHPEIEWIEDKRKPPMLKTVLGSMRITSKYCIQILHAKNPKECEQLQKFLYDVLFNNEQRRLIDIIKEEWYAFEEMLGVK